MMGSLDVVKSSPQRRSRHQLGCGSGRADIGAADDLQGVLGEDLVSYGMANVFSNAHNVAFESR